MIPSPIMQATAAYFGIELEELYGRSQNPAHNAARHVAMYLEHEAGNSYAEIGRRYNRNHSGVIAACRHMKERVEKGDERYTGAVSAIAAVVKANREKRLASTQIRELDQLCCPTCGAPVIRELQKQIAKLQTRIEELDDQVEGLIVDVRGERC